MRTLWFAADHRNHPIKISHNQLKLPVTAIRRKPIPMSKPAITFPVRAAPIVARS
jgi:hypothetical protein